MLSIDHYFALRERPTSPVVMWQRWRSLLFLHYSSDPEEVQATLPAGLTVDTFDGRAWVGLVPFRMEGVRPRGLPAVRGLSDFPETNVRTYVHREGREPGVWFYSLDAANGLACAVARRFFGLPYHHADMEVEEANASIRYESLRREGGVESRALAEIGEPIPSNLFPKTFIFRSNACLQLIR